MIKKLSFITLLISFNLIPAPNFIITNVFDKPIYVAVGDSKNDPLKAEVKKINPKETFSTQVDMKNLPSFMVAPFDPVPGDRVFVYEFTIPKPSITPELVQQATDKAIKEYEPIFNQQMKQFGFTAETIKSNFEQLKKNPEQNPELNNLINMEVAKLLPKAQYAEYENKFRESLVDKNIIFAINFVNKGKIITLQTKERKYLYEGKQYSEEDIKNFLKTVDKADLARVRASITIQEVPKSQTLFSTVGYEPVLVVPSRWFPRKVNEVSADNLQQLISLYPLCYSCDALKILAHIHGYDSIKLGENNKILGLPERATAEERDLAYKILKNGTNYLLLSENVYYQTLFYHLIEIVQNAYSQLGGHITLEDAALRQISREKERGIGIGGAMPPTGKPAFPSKPSRAIERRPLVGPTISLQYAKEDINIAQQVAQKIQSSVNNIEVIVASIINKLDPADYRFINSKLQTIQDSVTSIAQLQIKDQSTIIEMAIKELNSTLIKLKIARKITTEEYNFIYNELQTINSVL